MFCRETKICRGAEVAKFSKSSSFGIGGFHYGATSLPTNPGSNIGWVTDSLTYSNGHLLLFQEPVDGDGKWLHVWKLEQAHRKVK